MPPWRLLEPAPAQNILDNRTVERIADLYEQHMRTREAGLCAKCGKLLKVYQSEAHMQASERSIQFEVSINADLHQDLVQQAALCELSPARYAAELVEAAIAGRRFEERHSVQPDEAQPARSGIYSLGA